MMSIGNNATNKFVMFVFLVALLSTLTTAADANGPEWWNDDWSHKMIVDPNPPDSTIENYPAGVTIDTSKLINAGAMNSDCSDIRVLEETSSGTYQQMSYTISNCDSTSTTIGYIMGDSSNNHYIYFGNSGANSAAIATGTTMKTYMENQVSTGFESTGSYSGWGGITRSSSSNCYSGTYCAYLDGTSGRFDFGNNFGAPYSNGEGLKGDYRIEWVWEETTNSCNAHIGGYSAGSDGIHFHGSNNPEWYRWLDDSSIYGSSVGGNDYDPGGSYGDNVYQRQDTDWSSEQAYSYTNNYNGGSDSNTDYWSGNYNGMMGLTMYNACDSFWGDDIDFTLQQSINSEAGVVNVWGRLRDSSGNDISGVSVAPVEDGTTNDLTANSGELCANNGQTDSLGKFECAVDHSRQFDLNTPFGKVITDIDFSEIKENQWLDDSKHHLDDTAYFDYKQYNRDDYSVYEPINFSIINQTDHKSVDEEVQILQSGTENEVFRTTGNYPGSDIGVHISQNSIYDLIVNSTHYQSELEFNNIRVPDKISAGENQNFIPESTMSNSLKFSAGHVLPSQTFITRPFSDFDVVNVSMEKSTREDFRLVSDVLVRKFNVEFEGSWQDWSNRKTVSVKEIYQEDWDDSTSGNNDAWGTISFNPEGFQNSDCSDVRLTDTNNNVQDYTITNCADDLVEMEYNVPINSAEEKDFYLYYGNADATDAQSAVEREGRELQTDFDTGNTGYSDLFSVQSQSGDDRFFNVTVPQNIDFTAQEMTLSGERTQYVDNSLPDPLDTDYQDFTGVEVEPDREYMLENITIQMSNTTTDTEFLVINQSTGNTVFNRDVPDNGAGEYVFDFHNDSTERTGDNTVFHPGDRYLYFIRYGETRRTSSSVTQRPMYNLEDNTVHRQLYSCNSDGTGCTEGDYPVVVSDISTVDPDYPTDVTVEYDGSTIWSGPNQLKDQKTIDLSDSLESEVWRQGDPINSPKIHEFTVTTESNGNISIGVNTDILFEHPVLEVTKDSSACSVSPESRTYFHIDRSDCPYLDRLNVSQGQWLKMDYRFRTPGPHDFGQVGDTNQYNVTDTVVRFDILTETEDFNG